MLVKKKEVENVCEVKKRWEKVKCQNSIFDKCKNDFL